MPIYDFACCECGRSFDELVRHDTIVKCPSCGSHQAERKLSLPAKHAAGTKALDPIPMGPPGGGCCGGACHGQRH